MAAPNAARPALDTDQVWRNWCATRVPRTAARPAPTRPAAPERQRLDAEAVFRGWVQATRRAQPAPPPRPPAGRAAAAQPLTDGEDLYRQAGQNARSWSARWNSLLQRLKWQSAGQRAERLLLAHLTPAQRQQYETEGRITVPGRLHPYYRINKGRVANVEVLDARGHVIHRLCAHPAGNVPDPDVMLAQVLMLHHHEREFVRVANRHPPR